MQKPTRQAFTLVELLISTVLLVMLLLILVSMINQTSGVWRFTTNKVEQFSRAQNAFDSITRRLSQATLNTYWDYEKDATTGVPTKYIRKSDLRFVSGSAQVLTGGAGSSAGTATRPGHGIFFQAPLGYSDSTDFKGLENLLNSWGYYIEFGSDSQTRPAFLDSLTPKLALRYRYRLTELMQPSNKLAIYSPATWNGPPSGNGWISAALSATPSQVHVLAENVVALVLLPKLSPKEDSTGTALSPGYSYDSTATNSNAALNSFNQLPPLVQVTLVALDDASAARVANGDQAPDLGISGLFDPTSSNSATNYQADLTKLQETLVAKRLNYRIFSTQVVLRAAKWSRN